MMKKVTEMSDQEFASYIDLQTIELQDEIDKDELPYVILPNYIKLCNPDTESKGWA